MSWASLLDSGFEGFTEMLPRLLPPICNEKSPAGTSSILKEPSEFNVASK